MGPPLLSLPPERDMGDLGKEGFPVLNHSENHMLRKLSHLKEQFLFLVTIHLISSLNSFMLHKMNKGSVVLT